MFKVSLELGLLRKRYFEAKQNGEDTTDLHKKFIVMQRHVL